MHDPTSLPPMPTLIMQPAPLCLTTTSRSVVLKPNNVPAPTSTLLSSIGLPVQHSINSKHAFGTGSLSPLQLVLELDAMFGTLTKDEITTTQGIIAEPLVHFADFREFCSTVTRNYEFLSDNMPSTLFSNSLVSISSLRLSNHGPSSTPTSLLANSLPHSETVP